MLKRQQLFKPPSHSGEDRVNSLNFDERSGDVVKVGELCNFHVHTTLLLGRCKVLTAPYTLILGTYYVPITHAPGPTSSYHVLTTSKKTASRAYHVLTASFQSFLPLYLIQS